MVWVVAIQHSLNPFVWQKDSGHNDPCYPMSTIAVSCPNHTKNSVQFQPWKCWGLYMFENRCCPTTFRTIRAGDADAWCYNWPVWSAPQTKWTYILWSFATISTVLKLKDIVQVLLNRRCTQEHHDRTELCRDQLWIYCLDKLGTYLISWTAYDK